MHEMQKPLARYQDDKDLDDMLKEQDRDGDPMLAFIKKKAIKGKSKGKKNENTKVKASGFFMPVYHTVLHITEG